MSFFLVFKRFLQFIYSLYAFILFAVLIVFVLFPCLFLCLPFGRIQGGNYMYDLYRFFGNLWLRLIGIHHTIIYESKPVKDEQYIFIANHISYLDAVVIISSVLHDFRPIGKHELLRIPIFGFLYRFCVITVNRSNPEDRTRSLNDLRKILSRGISAVIFPEGTFNMIATPLKEMYDGAFRLSIEMGKKIQPILLLDTYDRLHYESIFRLTPGISRAIYLDPIDPLELGITDPKILKEKVSDIMAKKLIDYTASWINTKYLNQT